MTVRRPSLQAASERTPLSTLLSVEEVAEYLGVPTGTLANWRHLGRGPAFVRVGRLIRYRAEDIAGWIEDRITYADDDSANGRRRHPLRSASR
jgi:excisionase family DNA binding protein